MARNVSFADCATAYECRDRLPQLSAWMHDDALKMLPLWHGRLEPGQMYFDLNNPERGAFTAEDNAMPAPETPYVCRRDVPQWVWAQLITWRQPVDESQAEAIALATPETESPETRGIRRYRYQGP